MDDPVFHSSLEFNRVLVDRDDHLPCGWSHPSSKGRQNEYSRNIEDGIVINYVLCVSSSEFGVMDLTQNSELITPNWRSI
jgi:hypothetical protein